MKYCTNCGNPLEEGTKFCPACGHASTPAGEAPREYAHASAEGETFFDKFTRAINSFVGGSGAVRPPIKTIFGGIFERHEKYESEEIFNCGTSATTPELGEDGKLWPRTWLWTRILIAFAAAFALLYLCCDFFGNTKTYPGLMVIGAFMVPIAVLVFFFELNTPRNISFFGVLKYFLVGGCASLIAAMILFTVFGADLNPYLDAVLTACIEESAKLAIIAVIVRSRKSEHYALNGLLIGAAIGAGFGAFESAGYAFDIFLVNLLNGAGLDLSYQQMMNNILLRAVLAPGMHVIWAAISGYAVALASGYKTGENNFLDKKAFWKVFWIPIFLHAVWNMPISFGTSVIGQILHNILLLILGWIVVFVMISNSLAQIGQIVEEKKKERERAEELFLECPAEGPVS